MKDDVELHLMSCPNCGVRYGLEVSYRQYRLDGATDDRGRKIGWYCPNGHPLAFTESEADKLRRERDRLKQQNAEKDDTIKFWSNKAENTNKEVLRLKKKAVQGTCPCCDRGFTNLKVHMKRKHPEFLAEAAE